MCIFPDGLSNDFFDYFRYFSNRCVTYLRLNQYQKCIEDADQALQLLKFPDFAIENVGFVVKALVRKGSALFRSNELHQGKARFYTDYNTSMNLDY
jgi:hypothetical protein